MPPVFSCLVVCFYLLLLLPMAASRDFDLSAFVLAGDKYVDHSKLAAPLATVPHSYGYDGQFYYRLARRPFSVAPTVEGVTLDAPAKRMQRILYPLLAWLISFGNAAWAPAALLLVNLAGLAAISAIASWLTRRRQLAWWFPFVVAGWPGFLIALTHDTAEIVAAAFCLAAVAFYLTNRTGAYCVTVAAAALSRETTIPIFLGPLIYEAWMLRASPDRSQIRRTALCALAFVPFALWHVLLGQLWNASAQPVVGNPDLGWPLAGLAQTLFNQLRGSLDKEAGTTATIPHRLFVFVTVCGLAAFGIAVVARLRRAVLEPGASGVAIGWCLSLVLMSLLTADGPWVGPHAYFRAFTECWIVGCLLLALRPAASTTSSVTRLLVTFAAADLIFLVWKLCYTVLQI